MASFSHAGEVICIAEPYRLRKEDYLCGRELFLGIWIYWVLQKGT